MNIFLDQKNFSGNFFPFSLTHHIIDIPVGILTIREKWQKLTGATIYTAPADLPEDSITITANLIPTKDNYQTIVQAAKAHTSVPSNDEFRFLSYPWEIVQWNDWAIRADFELLTHGKSSAILPGSVRCSNPDDIFISPTATVKHCIINAETGPVFIGPGAVVMEGTMIRGPFALGENSIVKMGSKIYGATHVGANSVVGGEIKNSVIMSNSNKAHDGYMGDSLIGSWCNWGAGTSNSNVKNTGSEVRYCLNPHKDSYTAGPKGGVLMGDYSRTAVNTVFNTGAVVGLCCNIFGEVSSQKYFDNFSWGNTRYVFDKALRDIENWKAMKKQELNEEEKNTLKKIYDNLN